MGALSRRNDGLVSTQDAPFALRTLRDFPPSGGSAFEDPGDEKSWHQSQRFEALKEFYAGRQPSWYANAVRPLAGARRVLDLGAGPALALKEILNQGAVEVLGIDRWPGFKRDAQADTPIVLHDLTLPMPFLRGASFDAVLSHYVLDYISPIGMRQVLREALRVLEPGGKLLLYLSATGLGSNDYTRTSPYCPRAMTLLLEEAGFVDLNVTLSPNGRNTIAQARRSADSVVTAPASLTLSFDRDSQLAAAFRTSDARDIEVELSNGRRAMLLRLDAGPRTTDRLACCVRVSSAPFGAEAQMWIWRGYDIVATQTARLDFEPTLLTIRHDGPAEEAWAWAPQSIAIEPKSDAYTKPETLRPASELTDLERSQEGRRVIIETLPLDPASISRVVGDISSRFLARRAAALNTIQLDREWQERRLHAIVLRAEELAQADGHRASVWASQRDVALLIEANDWDELVKHVGPRVSALTCPLLLVDPALVGSTPSPVPEPILALARTRPQIYLLLGAASSETLTPPNRKALRSQILAGGSGGSPFATADADEALRYLTERALLKRLRYVHTRTLADIGRLPPLTDAGPTTGEVTARITPLVVMRNALIDPAPEVPLPTRLPTADDTRVGGAAAPTTVFLTVDTEDTYFDQPRLITGEGLGRELGVYGILDTLDARGLRATFFINVYESERQPPGSIEAVVREIALRGHEVALHTHQSPELPFFQKPLFRLSLDEQLRVLRWGLERLEAWTGKPVRSFRAGGYALNDATFEALERLGIRIDSSCFFGSANNQFRQRTVNGVHRRGRIVEVPITSVLRGKGDRAVEHRKLDVDWLNSKQILEGVTSMAEHGAGFAMLMMHSFTFIEKLSRRAEEAASPRAIFTSPEVFGRVAEIYGTKPSTREGFANLLGELSQAPSLQVKLLGDCLSELETAIDQGVRDVVPIVAP